MTVSIVVLRSGVGPTTTIPLLVNHGLFAATFFTIAGVSGTGQVGSITPEVDVPLTGVSATGAVGTLIAGAVQLSGVSGTGTVGNIVPTVSSPLTGLSATGQVGSVTANPRAILSGVSGTGQVGVVAPQFSSGSVALTGVFGTGQVGTLSASTGGFTVLGVAGTGQAGLMFVKTSPEPEVVGYSHVINSALIRFMSYSPEDQLLAIQFQPRIQGMNGERITFRNVPYYVALSLVYSQQPDLYYKSAIVTQFPTA